MNAVPHALIGGALGAGLGAAGNAAGLPVPDPVLGALLGATGALLPDADSPGGWLRWFGPNGTALAEAIRRATYPPARRGGTGHRGACHSLLAAALLFAGLALPALLLPPPGRAFWLGCALFGALGYLSHLWADGYTVNEHGHPVGVPLFVPWSERRWVPRGRRRNGRPAVPPAPRRLGARPAPPQLGRGPVPCPLPPDYTDAEWRPVWPEPLPGPRARRRA